NYIFYVVKKTKIWFLYWNDLPTSPSNFVSSKEGDLYMLSTVCHKYTKLHGRFCDALPRAGELSVKLVAIEIFETEMNYKYIGEN
ncbi:TPA: hypothetical protein ACQFLP_003404, partial [Proteus mirabilis]